MPSFPQIGILTFHRCINYGSYWQARCMVEGLRSLGYDAVLMDHRSAGVDRAEWRCALDPVPGAPETPAERRAYANKTRRFLEAFANLPLSAPFSLDRPEEADEFDLVVVGSDEVWNLAHPWYGGKPTFYGQGLKGELVSYAASFGNQDADRGLEPYWGELLRSFSAIGVRDQNSRQIVTDALDRDPDLVLDPCLQFPDEIEGVEIEIEPPYAAVYGHSFPDWFGRQLRTWAEQRNLPLVSIGYHNEWAHRQWIDADPLQFAGFMVRASAVATNFFHGCIFALRNGKPFICAPSEYRNNKVRDLLGLVDSSERLLPDEVDVDRIDQLLHGPAAPKTYDIIDGLRGTSRRYLDHVLQ